MQNSAWKISTWLWLSVYIVLTSVGGNNAFTSGHAVKFEKQNEAHFTTTLNPTNQSIQPASADLLVGQLNAEQLKDKGFFNALIGLSISQAIPFKSVHLLIDFQAIECAFAGLDHVFPFHYFW